MNVWRTAGAVALVMLISATPVRPAVFRCASSDGRILFTQFACPPHTSPQARDSEQQESDRISFVDTPVLSPQEKESLAELENRLKADRRDRRRDSDRRARAMLKQRREAEQLCDKARSELDKLEVSRRQGYSTAEGRRFDAAEDRWRQAKKSAC